jgi:biofilm PGA synthesis N-glycosyltransferase PgaC
MLELQALTAVTAGAIGNKNAVMCNGANMAFDRKIFLELDPYKHNLHISSGDDMFLLMAMQKEQHEKIYFLAHQNAIVYTQAKANFSDYLNQRIRWASKSKNYQNKVVKVVALLVLNYNAVILLSPIMFFIDGWEKGFVLFLSLILLKQLADGLILSIYSKKMKASINYFNLLLFQYLEALLTLIVAIKSIKGSYVWKGRKQHF